MPPNPDGAAHDPAERSLRVLIVADAYPPANLRGAAVCAQAVAEGLRRQDCEVLVVTHGQPVGRRGWVLRLASGPVSFAAALVIRGAELLREFRPDLVELTGPVGGLLASSARLYGVAMPPVVADVHGPVHREMAEVRLRRMAWGKWVWPSAGEWAFRWLTGPASLMLEQGRARRCARFVCVSEAVARLWAGRYGRRQDVTVIHNGVDTALFRPRPEDARGVRDRLGLRGVPVVFYAGSVRVAKGLDVLMAAMRGVRERYQAAALLVAGDRRQAVLRLAARLGLAEGVRFTGWLGPEELAACFSAADVVCVPSRYEPFGLVLAQAMACGRAVVATAAGGTPEVLGSGDCGRLVPPGDSGALAEAICSLLGDAAGRTAMGLAARARACERFRAERMVADRLALYRALARTG